MPRAAAYGSVDALPPGPEASALHGRRLVRDDVVRAPVARLVGLIGRLDPWNVHRQHCVSCHSRPSSCRRETPPIPRTNCVCRFWKLLCDARSGILRPRLGSVWHPTREPRAQPGEAGQPGRCGHGEPARPASRQRQERSPRNDRHRVSESRTCMTIGNTTEKLLGHGHGHSGSGGGAVPTTRGVAVADEFAGASILIVARSPTPPPVTPDMGISAIRRCQPTQRVGLWGGCSSGPAAPGDSVVGE